MGKLSADILKFCESETCLEKTEKLKNALNKSDHCIAEAHNGHDERIKKLEEELQLFFNSGTISNFAKRIYETEQRLHKLEAKFCKCAYTLEDCEKHKKPEDLAGKMREDAIKEAKECEACAKIKKDNLKDFRCSEHGDILTKECKHHYWLLVDNVNSLVAPHRICFKCKKKEYNFFNFASVALKEGTKEQIKEPKFKVGQVWEMRDKSVAFIEKILSLNTYPIRGKILSIDIVKSLFKYSHRVEICESSGWSLQGEYLTNKQTEKDLIKLLS